MIKSDLLKENKYILQNIDRCGICKHVKVDGWHGEDGLFCTYGKISTLYKNRVSNIGICNKFERDTQ